MDFRDTPEQAKWRQEVRDFIESELPDGWRGVSAEDELDEGSRGVTQQWRRKLAARGWIAPAWPKEYGGAAMGIIDQFILSEELARAQAPPPDMGAVGMFGPTIIVYGTEEQKKQHLAGILSGEVRWCQLYSEPGSGSDLASLQTRAVRDGDDYIINGRKIWTSGAHRSQRGVLLARTDPAVPKHKGISYFLLDMKTPGITVQPLIDMEGSHMFNEVLFEDVRVPKRDLLGEENRGWYQATTTLDFERSSIGSAVGVGATLDDLLRYARQHHDDDTTVFSSKPMLRNEFADRRIEVQTALLLSYRVVTMQAKGLIPNHEASCAKLFTTELTQRVARTGLNMLGLYGQLATGSKRAPLEGKLRRMYLRTVPMTIMGGTSEIQRNIIAGRGLGMPRS